jgi:flagellar biosynthetic protein FlhB
MVGTDADDRTQGPSKQRLRLARERGQVAQSPELTAAVGLLAATLLLGWWGDGLVGALITLVREPLTQPANLAADAPALVAQLRRLAVAIGWPLGVVFLGTTAALVAAQQLQVGGLWVPGLLSPDPARLWAFGRGPGGAARGARGAWGLVKVLLVGIVAGLAIRAGLPRWQQLGGLEPHALAVASAAALRQFTLTLAIATLVLGLLDFWLQQRRFTILLRMTPEEQREDLRSTEGDPVLRAQRRRIARTRQTDQREVLDGAVLLLTGAGGLTLVIAGGPPPRRLLVRSTASGAAGLRLRRAADRTGLPEIAAPALARRLATHRFPSQALSAEDAAALAALWPADEGIRLPGESIGQ